MRQNTKQRKIISMGLYYLHELFFFCGVFYKNPIEVKLSVMLRALRSLIHKIESENSLPKMKLCS